MNGLALILQRIFYVLDWSWAMKIVPGGSLDLTRAGLASPVIHDCVKGAKIYLERYLGSDRSQAKSFSLIAYNCMQNTNTFEYD